MRSLKKIVLFPIKLFLRVISILLAGLIKLECRIAGYVFMFLALCILMTIIKGTWYNLGILAVIVFAVIMAIKIPFFLQLFIDDQLEKLNG